MNREDALELLAAAYLSNVSTLVLEELQHRRLTRGAFAAILGMDDSQARRLRRKLTGEYPATLQDIMLWAVALNRPDLLLAPCNVTDLVPDELVEDVLLLLPKG